MNCFKMIVFSVFFVTTFLLYPENSENPDIVLNIMTEKERSECLKDTKLTDERYIIRKDGKSGFIDGCGRVVVEPVYDSALEFTEGLARVEKNRKYGYIDKNGKVVIAIKFDDGWFFREGFARVKMNWSWGDVWGYVNTKGEFVVKPQYVAVYSFFNGSALVFDGKRVKLIDKTGKALKEFENTDVGFNDAKLYFKKKESSPFCHEHNSCEKTYFYDYSGQKFYDLQFDKVFSPGKKSVVDLLLNTINNIEYEEIQQISENRFAAKKQADWLIYNEKGEKLSEKEFSYIEGCEDGLIVATAKSSQERIVMDKDFNTVFKGNKDLNLRCPHKDKIIFSNEGKLTLYDMKQKKILLTLAGTDTKNKIFEYMRHFDGKILITKGLAENSTMEIWDNDMKTLLLKVKPAGSIELFKTMEKDIRILKWKDRIYYLDGNYRVFRNRSEDSE